MDSLIEKAKLIRKLCLESVTTTKSSHIGSMLSMVDMSVYLFYEKMKNGDRFVLSKGHAALVLYAILYDKGIIGEQEYGSYCTNGSYLISHASHKVDGIEVSSGALGHGLAIAAGLAWSYKMDYKSGRIYCVLGDGECQEGSIWESLIFIANSGVDNITILIDVNNLQAYSDTCESLFSSSKFLSMLEGTGIEVRVVNGHDFDEIHESMNDEKQARIIFMHTVKGKGISYMENRFEWHYKSPNKEQYSLALGELG